MTQAEADAETCRCPHCTTDCLRESVDVGIGVIYGPWGCPNCGWSEDDKYDSRTGVVRDGDSRVFDPYGVSYHVTRSDGQGVLNGYNVTNRGQDVVKRRINYHTTCELWLHLEDYTNAGLEQKRMIKIINAMPDIGSATLNLSCTPMGVNSNLIVRTSATKPDAHVEIVADIEVALENELFNLQCRKLE